MKKEYLPIIAIGGGVVVLLYAINQGTQGPVGGGIGQGAASAGAGIGTGATLVGGGVGIGAILWGLSALLL